MDQYRSPRPARRSALPRKLTIPAEPPRLSLRIEKQVVEQRLHRIVFKPPTSGSVAVIPLEQPRPARWHLPAG
jgi:hypothetical protein